MITTPSAHWEQVWHDRDPDLVTWFQAVPTRSLDLITGVAGPGDGIVDVGGGASRLVDHLLDRGYRDLTVVDLSPTALAACRNRLGDRADDVTWVVGDATTLDLGRRFSVWHDRAVFHFLVDDRDRSAYADRVRAHLEVGGHLAIATFGPDGPEQCSGLPVRRSDAMGIAAAFGDDFELLRDELETHVSPTGVEQQFQYALLRRRA